MTELLSLDAGSPSGLSVHTLSLEKALLQLAARSLLLLDRTLQAGTNLQTGKLRNIALKHAVPLQTAAVSLQEAVTFCLLNWRHSFVGCLQNEEADCPCQRQEGNLIAQPRRDSWVGSWGSE